MLRLSGVGSRVANEKDQHLSTALGKVDRRIVPRWRASVVAATTGELDPLWAPESQLLAGTEELTARAGDWRTYRSTSFAADLISAGLVLDSKSDSDVMEAGEYILSLGSEAPEPLRKLAFAVRDKQYQPAYDLADELDEAELLPRVSYDAIRALKARLKVYPQNALLWVDMARHYAMLGANDHALRSIRNGISLAKDNRFVLRSAARLYVHLGDVEQAYDLLRKSSATRRDPWLRAAEIAVAGMAAKTPAQLRNTKRGLASTNYAPLHISELASAVATFELKEGSIKSARQLFNLGLQQPTENAVAQADWAKSQMSGISLNDDHFLLPRTFEARANLHLDRLEFQDCMIQCNQWLEDEPFSSRPVEIGTFISISALEDYDRAVKLAKWGLRCNHDHFLLLNNLTVAYAEMGDIDEAKRTHQTTKVGTLNIWELTCWLATKGMLAFREGYLDEGRQLYEQALVSAGVQRLKEVEAMVLIHWAREEYKAGELSEGDKMAAKATQASRGLSSSDVKIAQSRLDKLHEGFIAGCTS